MLWLCSRVDAGAVFRLCGSAEQEKVVFVRDGIGEGLTAIMATMTAAAGAATGTPAQTVHCQLWMGGLEPYMNEAFIMEAFRRMGEPATGVIHKKNKFTGDPAGYCFVQFPTDEMALNAMHKLNGKLVPNTNPSVRFRLNHAGGGATRPSQDKEYSLWVGDLTPEVDDYTLYKAFAARYPSIRTAKVILDTTGYSRGYGFVRFASEEDQKNCLISMNGYKGLGGKPLKISNAVAKTQKYNATTTPQTQPTATTPTTPQATTQTTTAHTGYTGVSQDYSQGYYDPSYWQNYSAWQGYYDQTGATDPNAMAAYTDPSMQDPSQAVAVAQEAQAPIEDDLELIEHNVPLDIEKLNQELCDQDYNMWDALEGSRWLPLDTLGLECAS